MTIPQFLADKFYPLDRERFNNLKRDELTPGRGKGLEDPYPTVVAPCPLTCVAAKTSIAYASRRVGGNHLASARDSIKWK